MRYPGTYVRPIIFSDAAYEKAKIYYALHSKNKFEDEVVDFLKHGWVYCSPRTFALMKMINIASEETNLVEPAWFIRFLIGDILEALDRIPGYLPYIVWCRNNAEPNADLEGTKFWKFRTDRLYKLSKARRGRKETPDIPKVSQVSSNLAGAERKVA